jgi:hypothetical protein
MRSLIAAGLVRKGPKPTVQATAGAPLVICPAGTFVVVTAHRSSTL